MKDSKSKVLKRVVSLGLAASFLPVEMNVGGFNHVYGASETEWSFVKKGLDQNKAKIKTAEAELDKVRNEYKRVKGECEKANDKDRKVSGEVDRVGDECYEVVLEEERAVNRENEAEKRAKEAFDEYKRVVGNIDREKEAENEYRRAIEEKEKTSREAKEAHDKVNKVFDELDKVRRESSKVWEEVKEIKKKLEKIKYEVSGAEDELRKAVREYRDFENEIKEAKEAVKTEDESEILGYMIRKAENEHKKAEEEIKEFQREVMETEEEIKEAKDKVKEASEKVNESRSRINEIEKNISVNIDKEKADEIEVVLERVMKGERATVEVSTADEYIYLVGKMNLEYGLVCEEYELAKESKVGLMKAINKKRRIFSTLVIVLSEDIDMNRRVCPTIMCFRGILNGGGHKLTNIIFTRKEGICNFGCVPGMVNDIEVENVSYIQEVQELKLSEEALSKAIEALKEIRDLEEKLRNTGWLEAKLREKVRLAKEKIEYLESLRA